MKSIDRKIREALREDVGSGDITSRKTVKRNALALGVIFAKEKGILCGIGCVERVFEICDQDLHFERKLYDGGEVDYGTTVAVVKGNARSILKGERVALNFLQQLSGIATLTRKFVEQVKDTGVVILDTRKTHPGLRELEKYAVKTGGGENHRMRLDKMILIKDNHIAVAGGIDRAIKRLKDVSYEIEVKNLFELKQAVELGATRVMLDNLPIGEIKKAVSIYKGKVEIEVSGGVTLDNVRDIAEAGVDYISIGALTHSARAIDFSLTLKPIERRKDEG
ncbi:MAG TPA: carboxylating nicotinate-nucleotide diphosphorylase [bacterium (Candidatus Stahlbacteria)]|nr:carboxylating nicotinate-nucleotide diphosphorylase [Candidatus Stahlbacteria bacterium]